MKFLFISVGNKIENEMVIDFTKRINHYFVCDWKIVKEQDSINLEEKDFVVLLDENGKELSSLELANFLEKRCLESGKRIVFIIGGAYGVDQKIKSRADFTWSLSKLVFPHELVRIILSEQIYRACTILKGEKYHHQ